MSPPPSTPAPAPGDAEIVRLILDRNAAGLRQLLSLHGDRTRGGLKKSFGANLSDSEIDDAMSKASFKAWRSVESYDSAKGTLRAWFYVIARNAGHEILRDRRRRRWETRGDDLEGVAATDEIPGTPPRRFLETLQRCIDELPRLQKEVIRADLATGDVADAQELAKRLRTSRNSIYVSRSTARKTLKQALLAQGYVPTQGTGQPLWN